MMSMLWTECAWWQIVVIQTQVQRMPRCTRRIWPQSRLTESLTSLQHVYCYCLQSYASSTSIHCHCPLPLPFTKLASISMNEVDAWGFVDRGFTSGTQWYGHIYSYNNNHSIAFACPSIPAIAGVSTVGARTTRCCVCRRVTSDCLSRQKIWWWFPPKSNSTLHPSSLLTTSHTSHALFLPCLSFELACACKHRNLIIDHWSSSFSSQLASPPLHLTYSWWRGGGVTDCISSFREQLSERLQ